MKVYPKQQLIEAEPEERALGATGRITKVIALIIAFVTVYYFFLKILFF